VASDLPSLRLAVRAWIEGDDVEILEASSGPEAVDVAVDEEVDVAILDLQIGSMGGIAVCSQLRNLESTGAAALVAGSTFEDDAWRPVTVAAASAPLDA